MVEFAGVCDICKRAAAMFSCQICGARVCRACYGPGGTCKNCGFGKKV